MTQHRDCQLTRRGLIQGVVAAFAPIELTGGIGPAARSARPPMPASGVGPYSPSVLPPGTRSRFVDNGNGITMHVLEAGHENRSDRPAVVLLHGFPELAYSWRKVMPALAAAGFHTLAPDLRGYGRTSGWDVQYDDDLSPFRMLNEVRDVLGLVSAFGHRSVAAVVGHDFGSPVAAWCALARPDVFRSVVMMSGPFSGPPALAFGTADSPRSHAASGTDGDTIYDDLERLTPPRKHYQRYYATREANDNLRHAPQGVRAFLRAYYHMKSADWKQNRPVPLKAWTASELAQLPRYYVMDRDKGMAETVAGEMPSPSEIASCKWLPEEELRVYSAEYGRTGFQGGLQSYRIRWIPAHTSELTMFSGRTIDVPSLFIAGKSDWGVHQRYGAFETMQRKACTRMVGAHLVEGAGHWVQQEQPGEVSRLLVEFLRRRA